MSLPNGTEVLKVLKEIHVICSALSSDAVAKRSLIDGLAVANSSALIKQDIKEISGSFVALANALVDIAPVCNIPTSGLVRTNGTLMSLD